MGLFSKFISDTYLIGWWAAINLLTPIVAMGTAIIHPVPHRAKRQSARMSKITNDGLTRSDRGCFIAVPIWQQWMSKG